MKNQISDPRETTPHPNPQKKKKKSLKQTKLPTRKRVACGMKLAWGNESDVESTLKCVLNGLRLSMGCLWPNRSGSGFENNRSKSLRQFGRKLNVPNRV